MTDILLKSVVVDDSVEQRALISKLVNDHPNLVLYSAYSNGLEAYEGIDGKEVDVIFLAVEMPFVSGFDLAGSIGENVQVIFCCTNAEHALKAFDYNTTDFLQKPIEKERFNAAVQRVIAKYKQTLGIAVEEEFIYVTSNSQKKKVILNQINWIQAVDDYVILNTEKGNLFVRTTMKSFLKRLPPSSFIRIHRSYTVNIKKIEKFCSTSVEIQGSKIPMSRKRSHQLEHAIING